MRGLCTTFTGRHRYEPRYDEHASPFAERLVELRIKGHNKISRDWLFLRRYVFDVCRYCGDVLKRPTP